MFRLPEITDQFFQLSLNLVFREFSYFRDVRVHAHGTADCILLMDKSVQSVCPTLQECVPLLCLTPACKRLDVVISQRVLEPLSKKFRGLTLLVCTLSEFHAI